MESESPHDRLTWIDFAWMLLACLILIPFMAFCVVWMLAGLGAEEYSDYKRRCGSVTAYRADAERCDEHPYSHNADTDIRPIWREKDTTQPIWREKDD